jgi:anti-sigma regulatory factor (Ser/Thr protein kinase)
VQPDGHVRELPPTGGRPLGAGVPPDVVPRRTRLALGEVVLLHTDGLVERPGRAAPDGLAALRHAAADAIRRPPTPADAHRTTPDRISQHVVEAMSEVGGYADDATVLAAQLRPAPVEPLRRRVPGTVAGLDELREALGTWLATLQVTDEDAVALRVALVETASNAIEHGEATEMTLDLVLRDDGVVELRLRDDGRWRVPEPSGERGLGLALARGLARELRVAHDADGTRVTFSRPVGHPIAQAPAADAPPDELEMPFALREEQRDDRLVLHVAGPVDSASAPTLEARLRRLSQGGTRPIDIDLAGTTLLASAGVRVLQSAVTTASVPPALIAPAGSPAAVVLRLVGLEHRG